MKTTWPKSLILSNLLRPRIQYKVGYSTRSNARYKLWSPSLFQIVATGGLFGFGDAIAQRYQDQVKFDPKRTIRMILYGLLVAGPLMVTWYKFLSLNVPNIFHRVLADQILAAPVSLLLYFGVHGILEGKCPEQIKQVLDEQFLHVLQCNYMIWPLVQFVNFKFVPINYQAVFVGSLSLGWNAFLSHRKHAIA